MSGKNDIQHEFNYALQMKNLVSENNSMLERIAEFEAVINKKNNEIDILQDMLSEANELNTSLESQLQALQQMQQQINLESTFIHAAAIQPQNIAEFSANPTDSIEEVKEKNRSLTTQILALKRDIENLQQSPLLVNILKKRIEELEKKIATPSNTIEKVTLYKEEFTTTDTKQALIPQQLTPTSFIVRIKNILLTPQKEWTKISFESTTPKVLLVQYILPLSLVPAVAILLGAIKMPISFWGASLMGIKWGIVFAIKIIATIVCGFLASTYIIDEVGPNLGVEKNINTTSQLTAFSLTAFCIAAIFLALPAVLFLSLTGLYSIYLLYSGVKHLKKINPDSFLLYFVITFLICLCCTFTLSIFFDAIIYCVASILSTTPVNK
jgi:hypothetical protein